MKRNKRIADLPKGPFKDEELMEICYKDALDRIEDALDMRQSILVECDKDLTIPLYKTIRNRRKAAGKGDEFLDIGNPALGSSGGGAPGGGVVSLLMRLEAIVTTYDLSDKVIVLQHLDLMALGADNILDRMARDMSYLLHFNPKAVFLAFKDPEIPLPDSLKRFFSMKVSIFGTERQFLSRIITKEEALRFGDEQVDIYKLYKHLSGLNVLQIRKLMERIVSCCEPYPVGYKKVHDELRERTLAASYVEIPDITFKDVGGCEKVKKQLEHDILRFVNMLTDENNSMDEIEKIEKRIPRNILFEGPPGTGKTLLAKALANRLEAAVIVVNGPEFIDKYVGESERKLRELFSKARKSPPAIIIFDELDSIGRRRSSEAEHQGHNDTVVNQLLTEMSGFRSDELVFVIGTTNHASALDAALLSRIKIFHIPYPNSSERREIFTIFNQKKDLELSPEKIDFLVQKTEAWINPHNWLKFGGREIEALCSAIDRETFGAKRRSITTDRLAALVEEQIEVHFPKITFEDIGGYAGVKKQLKEDILSMMELAKKYRRQPKRLAAVEGSIPRGVIFEGPPGTGKTLLAMALANALGASIIVISASELKSSYYGESEKKVRVLFDEAQRNSPTVIVFDEMDAIMSSRSIPEGLPGDRGSVDGSLVNQLLTEMDGLKSRDMVFVVGATNLASVLDPAFKRPSRFSRIIHIPYPAEEDRREIISLYNKKYGLGLTGKQREIIIEETENWIDANKYIRFSGDHLRSICQSLQRRHIKAEAKGEKSEVSADELRSLIKAMIRVPLVPVDMDKDIGGYEEVKRALKEDILEMLELVVGDKKDRTDQIFEIKHSIPKGVLFFGPPGTGKTLFARALATRLRASIRVVNGPELKSAWHGETERLIREIFDMARRYPPSVIVFDEFDSLAADRRALSGVERSAVNQILTEMDGLREKDLVFIIATTNHPDSLDEAMMRPGRFEFQIEIPYPDEEARRSIFKLYNKKYRLGLSDEQLDYLVFRTEMVVDIRTGRRFSGDHIEAVCRTLMREKYRNPGLKIDNKKLDAIVRGRTNQPEQVTDEEKEIIALHEAGHAIVGSKHPKGVPPRRISIVSELAGTLGYVWHGEPENRSVRTNADLRGQICQLLGGRAAEILIRGEQSIGCANDLKEATRLATAMVISLGMDEKIGPRCMPEAELEVSSGAGVSLRKVSSHPNFIQAVDEGINRILSECSQETDNILEKHKKELIALRDRLLKEETINYG